ncbi:MAG: aminoacyl-tRNA hydrolase, partial [Alphaproteobacteria bacterium]
MASRAIIGHGNPGARYAGTRHNAGFLVVERLAARHALAWRKSANGSALVAEGDVAGSSVRLVEPLTFMNRSGEVLDGIAAAEGLSPRDLLVVHDEVDLPFGRLKLKQGGGNAGHRGLRSIQEHLGGDAGFARLRVGVGRPPAGMETADWVLADFDPAEASRLEALLESGADGCEAWLSLELA